MEPISVFIIMASKVTQLSIGGIIILATLPTGCSHYRGHKVWSQRWHLMQLVAQNINKHKQLNLL